jgi:hypothetical protein
VDCRRGGETVTERTLVGGAGELRMLSRPAFGANDEPIVDIPAGRIERSIEVLMCFYAVNCLVSLLTWCP